MWDNGGPKTVFIVKKTGSAKTTAKLKEIALWSVVMCCLAKQLGLDHLYHVRLLILCCVDSTCM